MSHEGGNNVLRLNHQLQGRDLIFKKVKEVSGGQFSFKEPRPPMTQFADEREGSESNRQLFVCLAD
jgi:hypothetical protein